MEFASGSQSRFLGFMLFTLLVTGCSGGGGGGGGPGSDITPPLVVATSPSADAQNVPVKMIISADFSEMMDPVTLNSATFVVSSSSGNIVCEVVTTSSTSSCTPQNPLQYNQTYTATINGSASDPSGNVLAMDYVWSFTTTASAPGDVGNYLPFNQGDQWTYQEATTSDGYTVDYLNTVSISGTAVIDGVTADVFIESNNDNSGISETWYYYKDLDGITNYGNADPGDFYTAQLVPYQEINFPVTPGERYVQLHKRGLDWGADLDGDGRNETFNILTRVTVVGLESVTTQSGTYSDSVKVKSELTLDLTLTSNNLTVTATGLSYSWYASGVGEVKRTIDTASNGNYQTDARELIAWTETPFTNAPAPKAEHSAIWTGSEMIVWGGITTSAVLTDTGAKYNNLTLAWSPTSMLNAPTPRIGHSAVWTGSEMIIWGGGDYSNTVNTGARYNPQTDTWTQMSTLGAPSPRSYHTAIWTGTEMIVWGGFSSSDFGLADGARYNPDTDTWTAMSTLNAPAVRGNHTAVWANNEMIVWGGENSATLTATGGVYNPSLDSWRATTSVGAPTPRRCHAAEWTGTEMIIFGGQSQMDLACGVGNNNAMGALYDKDTDSWRNMSSVAAPVIDYRNTVWTGSEMLAWGVVETSLVTVGARFNPASNSWANMSGINQPSRRINHTSIWTGTDMLVWGGEIAYGAFGITNSGGIYSVDHDPIN